MFLDLLKILPHYLLPKQGLTQFAGFLANVKKPEIKNYLIQDFIRKYKVNMKEALVEDPEAYSCFNDFFIRHLKPECRPLAEADIVSPVDGAVSELGIIQKGQLVQAKGRQYSVAELLACSEAKAELFTQGLFATLYLAPKDYHRVHMPLDAELQSMTYIPGALFSVQAASARIVPKLFARNERLIVYFKTEVGPMVMVLVGATLVGAIATSWSGTLDRSKKIQHFDYSAEPLKIAKGEEMGYFKLGSTVILLFAEGQQLQWNKTLKPGSSLCLGQALGDIKGGERQV